MGHNICDSRRGVYKCRAAFPHLTENEVAESKRARFDAARQLAARLLDDPAYLENLGMRLRAGILAPALEVLLYHYRYGKPVEQIEVSQSLADLRGLTDEELAEEMGRVQAALMAAAKKRANADEDGKGLSEPVH
jgi:protein-disulfide isomerase-like protein with CxxC motif